MHVLCESRQSHRDSLSLSSSALTKHDLQTCCWVSTVGNPIFCTEHKHPHFWTISNQKQTEAGPTDVLHWCVAEGVQPGGWNQSWTMWSINKNQSHFATVELVYTVFSYMKATTHSYFNPNPRFLFSKGDFRQRVKCCVYWLLLKRMSRHLVYPVS